jgi:hypothetical protein
MKCFAIYAVGFVLFACAMYFVLGVAATDHPFALGAIYFIANFAGSIEQMVRDLGSA